MPPRTGLSALEPESSFAAPEPGPEAAPVPKSASRSCQAPRLTAGGRASRPSALLPSPHPSWPQTQGRWPRFGPRSCPPVPPATHTAPPAPRGQGLPLLPLSVLAAPTPSSLPPSPVGVPPGDGPPPGQRPKHAKRMACGGQEGKGASVSGPRALGSSPSPTQADVRGGTELPCGRTLGRAALRRTEKI